MKKYIFLLLTVSLLLFSCESEKDRKAKVILIEQERIEQERLAEVERKETAIRLEKKRKEKVIYDKYINNSLRTGSKPYAYCFGSSNSCDGYGCSQIKVKTPSNSDVLVTIKKNGKVYRHAYINSSSSYTFNIPNGRYQTFFYYGKGWNPKKFMKETTCGTLKGGFIESEHFGKDEPEHLSDMIRSYELILQQNGNFSTRPSNSNEAF